MDDLLLNVSEEVKKLQRKVDDAEWDDDPRLAYLARELAHFKELEDEGVVYEPKF
tara:strand:- start:1174 stop:1338 length:165 start_codon:yes stop_codon:yes gene_type:complete